MHSEVDFVANLYRGVEKAMVPSGLTFSLLPLQLGFCNLFPFLVAGSFCVAVLLPFLLASGGVLAGFSSQLVARQCSTIVPGS